MNSSVRALERARLVESRVVPVAVSRLAGLPLVSALLAPSVLAPYLSAVCLALLRARVAPACLSVERS